MKTGNKKMCNKYEKMFHYAFLCIMVMIVSLICKYALLFTILDAKNPLQLQISVIISWIVSVIFGYVIDNNFYNHNKNKINFREISMFLSSRITDLIIEAFYLWFFITFSKFNTHLYVVIWTVTSQILVIIYLLSKFLISSNDIKIKFKIKPQTLFNILLFLIILAICYFFPYTDDDWFWGTDQSITLLKSGFKNYNGRYISNIFVILFTRFRFIRAIITSLSLLLIVKMISSFVNKENKHIPWLVIILLLTMPLSLFKSTISWSSGFVNYVLSCIIPMFIIYLNRKIFTDDEIEIKNRWIIPCFLLGICASLFMEHITIYNFFLCFFLIIYSWLKKHQLIISNLTYGLGSFLGTVLMFSNGAYRNIANGVDEYRSVGRGNIIREVIDKFLLKWKDGLVQNNIILNSIIIILCLVLVYYYFSKRRNKMKTSHDKLLKMSVFILTGYLCYNINISTLGGG